MKKRMEDVLIYYGWLNSFNSSVNGWDNEKVAQELAKYDILIFGDGIQMSGHGDYSNTSVIIPRIKELNTDTKIFGYVSVNQTLSNFQDKVDAWNDLEVDGIFMDEAGYDYGKIRSEFNDRVDYVHSQSISNKCIANAWNSDHILGVENDASYPNTTYNANSLQSNLNENDFILIESFGVNTDSYQNDYESYSNLKARAEKAVEKRKDFGVSILGCGIIADNETNGQDMFDFSYIAAMIYSFDGYGTSDSSYGASSAKSKYWDRPDIEGIEDYYSFEPNINLDGSDIILRYLDNSKLSIDFSDNSFIISKY